MYAPSVGGIFGDALNDLVEVRPELLTSVVAFSKSLGPTLTVRTE